MTLGLAVQSAKHRGMWQLPVWSPEYGWGLVICPLRPLESTPLTAVWSLARTEESPQRLQGFLGFSVVPASPVVGTGGNSSGGRSQWYAHTQLQGLAAGAAVTGAITDIVMGPRLSMCTTAATG